MLHHGPSIDFRELRCPLFHNLSELSFTLDHSMNIDFGLLLDLLALSPRLRLLYLHIDHYYDNVCVSFERFTGRTVNLPYMQRLVLEVNRPAELVNLILEHVTLPLNLKWRITSQHVSEFANSPALLQCLSQARFISQHIRLNVEDFALVSFEEEPGPSHINQFNHNKLMFMFEDLLDLIGSWDSLMHSIEPSRITHLNLVFLEWLESGNNIAIPTILTSMTNLETLDITENEVLGNKKTFLYCLSILLPGQTLAPDWSDWIPINTDNTSITPSFPSPFLREITIKMKHLLEEIEAVMIRKCSEKRREGGYPLRILAHCPRNRGTRRLYTAVAGE